ncbi:biotin transporter BioY [Corynebacterium poyangense]|uniref:Biotin transporter n=1 Tax=Corynebacterium poyangense TaxID=2684405 RepID=A0A7H0SPD4_9CORY|nr:biotin transporter BioY [Corynebacterium poyangense]QNQ90409.1 biotin transporter BioY [Corynebacterium poyangense]
MTNSRPSYTTADLAYITVFAALICVLGFFSIPIGGLGVPIVLQNAGIILAGLVLGGRRGTLTTCLFLIIGIVLPVLAGGRTTLAALAGPTAGYLLGYILSAFVAGIIAYQAPEKKLGRILVFALASIAAVATQYLFGILGLMWRSSLDFTAALIAQGPYILGDIYKLIFVIIIALGVHMAFPDLIRHRSRP